MQAVIYINVFLQRILKIGPLQACDTLYICDVCHQRKPENLTCFTWFIRGFGWLYSRPFGQQILSNELCC